MGFGSPTSKIIVASPTEKKTSARKKMRHPLYKGVRQRKSGKWVSEMREPTKPSRIWLGTFQTPEMAAVAHDVAALALHGEAAALNFPASAHRLPPPASSSHVDIRRAALKAATDFTSLISYSQNVNESCEFVASSSSSSTILNSGERNIVNVDDCSAFVDEEAIFNVPLLMDSMAEGMLLTPPAMKRGFNWCQEEDDDEIDFTLWTD